MRTAAKLTVAALALPLAVAACGKTSSNHSVTPAERASASALASVPGADAQQILIHAGVPVHGTSAQQIAFARSMMSKANRHALALKLHVGNPAAFQAQLLDAAKRDHVVTSHAGRVQFLDKDLENIYTVNVG